MNNNLKVHHGPRLLAIAWACTDSHYPRALRALAETKELRHGHALCIYREEVKPFSLPVLYNHALDALIERFEYASHYMVVSADIVIEAVPDNLSRTAVTFGKTRNYNGVREYVPSSVRIIPRALRMSARLCEEFEDLYYEDLDFKHNVLNAEEVVHNSDFLTKHIGHDRDHRHGTPLYHRNRELFERRFYAKHGRNYE